MTANDPAYSHPDLDTLQSELQSKTFKSNRNWHCKIKKSTIQSAIRGVKIDILHINKRITKRDCVNCPLAYVTTNEHYRNDTNVIAILEFIILF